MSTSPKPTRATRPSTTPSAPFKGLPDSLKITQITPPMTEVELDAKIKRTVRVRPAVIGEPAEGWARGSITIHPESVEIEGPESVLRDMSEVSTDIVNISGRTRVPVVADVAVKPPSFNLNPTTDAPVSVRVTVDALLDNRTFTDVPVIVDSGWTANPPVAKFVDREGADSSHQRAEGRPGAGDDSAHPIPKTPHHRPFDGLGATAPTAC